MAVTEIVWLILICGVIYYIYGQSKNKSYSNQQSMSYSSPVRLNEKRKDILNATLSDEQQKLFHLMEKTNKSLFITGKAGTGKSFLLQYFKMHSMKKVAVVAFTGTAALNVGGQTINSFFRLPLGLIKTKELTINYNVASILRNLETLVIDEISMVRVDMMEAIDFLLQKARSNNLPFGGIQIIMFGDLYQLPPVVDRHDPDLIYYLTRNFKGVYFFNSQSCGDGNIITYELVENHRQHDKKFLDILNSIREGNMDHVLISELNKRALIQQPTEEIITLVPTNQRASEINSRKLSQLNEKLFEYKAEIYGNITKNSFPTEEILQLKKGALVMLVKNDKNKRWVNGTLAKISSLSEEEIKVDIDGHIFIVNRETWNSIRYNYNSQTNEIEEEVVSSFTQFPLRLAWALTINKAQGKTLESAVVDMADGAFAHGQTYVALSRCKSLERLYLKRPILREDIIVDSEIINFMKNAKISSLGN